MAASEESTCLCNTAACAVGSESHISNTLLIVLAVQAGKLLDLQYVDPYAAEVYSVQQKKWDHKKKPKAAEGYTASAASASMTPLSA